ncbi:UNVERIFIED_ORG: hypothetical protein QE448_001036 [Rhizobium sp. SORGH_AS285]|uniref:SphA family protein n=2 Tax=Agrobacterium TaxID=357 RepID=UPI00277F438C|nr:transporter [Agrobacterium pusense]MDP9730980.1 hypothetical protein [Rhizobium sp. SORGH_AS_0285]MDP9772252.1 hypothetical protein [Rhizobium sp. SORGH_AS_0755]MDR6079933.1 hypothetical protein [Agrobacterium sp. SORGH_AS_0440]
MKVGRRLTLMAAGASLISSPAAFAAEGGAGFYLLGSKGPAAAITPPPGVYFQHDLYMYRGDLGGDRALPAGGRLALGVEGDAIVSVPTIMWVLPEEIAGGHLGLGASLPIGWKKTDADLTIAGPLGGVGTGAVSDAIFTVGDPIVSAFLGWETGNFHWQVGTMVNVPIGDYQKGEISNISFNHWGADVFAAATWLDPNIGLDISGVIGMTFNAENPATDYRTGNEFHFEWAAVQHFNKQFDAGLVGYYYNQVTGDSGAGARSAFKGEVAAIGATIGYSFMAGELPVSTRLKFFHEFAAENRAEGNSAILTISVPLSIAKPVSTE